MNAIIYICHGSRVPEGREQAVNFINKLMKQGLAPIQEYCFLELAEPTIEEAFVRCVKKGAKKIAAIPVLLLTAAHAKQDIPNELSRAAARFPNIEVKYGEPIGVNTKMIEALKERLDETGETITENSLVLLVGRGSSDPDVKRDLNKIAAMFQAETGIQYVETCFLTGTSPSLEEGLETAANQDYDKVFIIPYLLFTGVLMKKMKRLLKVQPNSGKYHLCNYLGYHPAVESILTEHAEQLLKNE